MAKPVRSAARTLAIHVIVPPRAIGPAAGHEYCLDRIAEVGGRAISWESLSAAPSAALVPASGCWCAQPQPTVAVVARTLFSLMKMVAGSASHNHVLGGTRP